jgi:hypothetical protein
MMSKTSSLGLRAEMSALIAQAGGEARVTLLQGFQLSESLINSLSAAYVDATKITFSQLDAQQRKAFEDTARTLAELDRMLTGNVSDINKTFQDWNTTLNNIAVWSSKPTVTRYWPAYFAPAQADSMIRVTISGFKLHSAELEQRPTLLISGVTATADEYSDNAVGFLISRKSIPQPESKSDFLKATLHLPQQPSCRLYFFCWEKPPADYGLVFTVLRAKLGSFKITTLTATPTPVRKPFVSRELVAEKESGSDAQHDCFVPEPGWSFDINSARPVTLEKSGWYKGNPDNRYNHGDVTFYEGIKLKDNICILVTPGLGMLLLGPDDFGDDDVRRQPQRQRAVLATLAHRVLGAGASAFARRRRAGFGLLLLSTASDFRRLRECRGASSALPVVSL